MNRQIKFITTKAKKNHNLGQQFIIKNQRTYQVQPFSYLGTTINKDWDYLLEMKYRI